MKRQVALLIGQSQIPAAIKKMNAYLEMYVHAVAVILGHVHTRCAASNIPGSKNSVRPPAQHPWLTTSALQAGLNGLTQHTWFSVSLPLSFFLPLRRHP